jgi:uncharacterized membrane protein
MPLSWALFEPVMLLGLYLLMLLLPLLDPWRRNYARFDGVYRLLRWLTVLFMSGVCAISKAEALGYDVDAVLLLDAGTALLFVVVGNVLGQIRPNFFVGIRVPWTLAARRSGGEPTAWRPGCGCWGAWPVWRWRPFRRPGVRTLSLRV